MQKKKAPPPPQPPARDRSPAPRAAASPWQPHAVRGTAESSWNAVRGMGYISPRLRYPSGSPQVNNTRGQSVSFANPIRRTCPTLSPRWAELALRRPQDGPKGPQEGHEAPKTTPKGPTGPQDDPTRYQDSPNGEGGGGYTAIN